MAAECDIRLTFGKYCGQPIKRVPPGYLAFMVQYQTQQWEEAEAELKNRGTIFPEVEISDHAINRASQRCLYVWERDREPDEGLHSWLCRVTQEALELGERDGEQIIWKDMKLVIDTTFASPILKTVMTGRER